MKRGLSLEEKREKMLQIFYDSQDFYLLKESEKSGPRKGVISQSVKDVVQSLVDDDLVSKDKIGTSSNCNAEAVLEISVTVYKSKFQAELGQFADNDPATFEAMNNIFTMRQRCSKNFPQAKEQLEHLYNEVGKPVDQVSGGLGDWW
uniref:Mnd1 HTH domain-containing protein n=1 Tax=Tanacetum cinerariifolium TaxID=118510 RepID=A0A6L2NQV2_TANCI|nr:hypothetical protein [Tanacetum cinerariifolium]